MSEEETLTEEQRITALENKVGKNRIVIIIVALTLIIILSVSTTVLILKLIRAEEPSVPISSFEAQKKLVEALSDQIKQQKVQIEHLKFTYEKSEVAAFQKNLIAQEQSYQEFLATLKVGMFDLAKMVQGSRTWLEIYTERVEEAQELSVEREQELKLLNE
jgi:hypothetical protein